MYLTCAGLRAGGHRPRRLVETLTYTPTLRFLSSLVGSAALGCANAATLKPAPSPVGRTVSVTVASRARFHASDVDVDADTNAQSRFVRTASSNAERRESVVVALVECPKLCATAASLHNLSTWKSKPSSSKTDALSRRLAIPTVYVPPAHGSLATRFLGVSGVAFVHVFASPSTKSRLGDDDDDDAVDEGQQCGRDVIVSSRLYVEASSTEAGVSRNETVVGFIVQNAHQLWVLKLKGNVTESTAHAAVLTFSGSIFYMSHPR